MKHMEICHNAAEELEYGDTLWQASKGGVHMITISSIWTPYNEVGEIDCRPLVTIAEQTGGKAVVMYMTCHKEGNFIMHVEVRMPNDKLRYHSFTVNESIWDAPNFRISRYTNLSQEAFEAIYA